MKTIIFSFLLSFIFSNELLFAQPYPFGDSINDGLTKETAYQIWTKEHLMELGDSINNIEWGKINWTTDKHFRLMQNIDNFTESIGWAIFLGYFHGGGKKITVAIVNDPTSNPYIGPSLFGASYGTIDSLIVDGFMDNINGGIVSGNANNGSITNCVNNANVSYSGIARSNSGIISNCINNGSITGIDRIGGIAGDNNGQIINCINTGKITATNSTGDNIFSGVGGIVGTSANGHQDISNCINIGTVEGQGYVGGIVGLVRGMSPPAPPSPITNCINYGLVTGTNGVGGIIGNMFNSFINITNCSNFGVVRGNSNVGCIAGERNNGGTLINNHYDKQMCGE